LAQTAEALAQVGGLLDRGELVLAAGELRRGAEALGRILGRTYSQDLLDAIFARFCVGK
jgi:tRNA modification GTPase